MAMDRINGSPLARPGIMDRFQIGKKDQDGSEKSSDVTQSDRSNTAPADRAEISDTAHQLMDLRAAVDAGRTALDNLPDVREDRVAEAKQRLEQGFYNSQIVQDEVAGILGKVFNKMDEL